MSQGQEAGASGDRKEESLGRTIMKGLSVKLRVRESPESKGIPEGQEQRSPRVRSELQTHHANRDTQVRLSSCVLSTCKPFFMGSSRVRDSTGKLLYDSKLKRSPV